MTVRWRWSIERSSEQYLLPENVEKVGVSADNGFRGRVHE
jgi:hypothetical protein